MDDRSVFPTSATPILGREEALAEVRALLSRDRARLVTLTGAGGSGKTRLALELAAELGPTFQSTWFVDLTAIRAAELVPSAIAHGIGVQEGGSKSLPGILQELLSAGPTLLVLDNFEHVLGAAPFVADLLGRCPPLIIVATSREVLAVRSEYVYLVEPLSVPDLEHLDQDDAVRNVPSMRLFEQRVRARRPGFQLVGDALTAAAEICVRLDGLPLAIELAAAQAAVLPPRVILARLSARAPFVLGGPRDLPARHQTLNAAVAWSYDLLEPSEKLVFGVCGVFAGGFAPEAVQFVTDGLGSNVDALSLLAQLVTKSLVRATGDDPSDPPRFALLETIRSYAAERLAESGDMDAARRRHAAFYVDLAERLQASLRGPGMACALDELAREYSNLRAVFQWASQSGDLAVGLRLAGALYRFWIARGHLAEARAWLEAALPRSEAVAPTTRAMALNAAGVMAGMQQDHVQAVAFFSQSLELWRLLGDSPHQAAALLNLGLVAQDTGRLADAQTLFERAEELYAAAGDRGGLANALGSRARIARTQGDLDRAEGLFRECLRLFRELGDDWGAANSLANLGHLLLALADRAAAVDAFRQSLRIRRALGNTLHIAESLEGLAAVAAADQPRLAAQLLGAAEALRETSGAPVPAVEQARYAELVARARERLREDTFAAAWSQGRGLSLARAIELALRDRAPPIAGAQASRSVTRAAEADGERAALSRRELEIAQLIGRGASNRAIADGLVLSVKTVETHIRHIFSKLHFKTRSEIAVWASQRGLV